MEILRTRFKKEIVSQFMMPAKPSSKVVIICSGMPTIPRKDELMEFFSKKGYWAFLPRYRGSWESAGEFLKFSPHQDVLDIMDELPKGFIDLANGKKLSIKKPEIYILGSSFGGPAALLVADDPRVKKVCVNASVTDWLLPSKDEPLGWLLKYVREAFGEGYRFPDKNWKKLSNGKFYNPINVAKKLPGEKILSIHTRDDGSVPYEGAVHFAKATASKLILLNKGGHIKLQTLLANKRVWKEIKKHLS